MTQSLGETYKEEAYELLAELETSLLAMEEAPDDAELIGRVFRALHTIKGSGAMFGFEDIAAFTHEVETVFDLVRNGRMAVTKPLVDLTLAANDRVRAMLDNSGADVSADAAETKEIIERLRDLVPRSDNPGVGATWAAQALDKNGGEPTEVTYRITFRPGRNIFANGTNPILLLNELRSLGECGIIAHTSKIPELENLNPEECFVCWDAILTTRMGIDAIKDIFIFVEDECELDIEVINEADAFNEGKQSKKLGEILLERGYITREDLQKTLGEQKRIGELLVGKGLIEPSAVESALAEQRQVEAVRRKQRQEDYTSSVRVPADKLDTLVNLVGELVTVQARLTQTANYIQDPEILSISEEVERLTGELRDNTMSIRMVPIGMTFSKFKRLVRDLAAELKKDVVLVTEGAETELDKTVIERLNDPMVHLIRNCIDHGIELPEARKAAGKPGHGTVHLSAAHSGANVLISIADDGAGLDAERIRAKAVERGLITADAELSEEGLFALIFAPGFSTARSITSVSGRGVGMDVVKRSIDALRGTVEISSRKGEGTTITLKLPLTLAIIDGLLVKVGDGNFVLPLSMVEECVELGHKQVEEASSRRITCVRGEIVPYIRLRESFFVDGQSPEIEQIVITESSVGKFGFVVDKVVGEHQTVIKNMGRMYHDVDVISGATILGDGTVALILDVPKLVAAAELGGAEATAHKTSWNRDSGRPYPRDEAKPLPILH
jgi:two-component system chemotaxis sensor kinase CheA